MSSQIGNTLAKKGRKTREPTLLCVGYIIPTHGSSTVFFGVLHPWKVHNLMGWVQKYEKKSNEKVRFPFSCTLSMYSKNENFFGTSPLICLIHLVQQASNDTMTQ